MRKLVQEVAIRGVCLAAGVALVVSLPITLTIIDFLHREKK